MNERLLNLTVRLHHARAASTANRVAFERNARRVTELGQFMCLMPWSADVSPTALKSILVVDEDVDFRLAITDLLRFEGYSVESAADVQGAIDCLECWGSACLVVVDLMLPGATGWDVLRWMRERRDPPPVIVVTGCEIEERDRPRGALVRKFLTKPIEAEDLLAAVKAACPA